MPDEPIPEVDDLQEVNAMLAERVTEWTEKWKREGKAEGKAEGKTEARTETTQNLLLKAVKLKFGNVPESINHKVRAISSLEILDNLFEISFSCSSIQEFTAYLKNLPES
jgi:predicted transposase YdaD